MFEDWNLCTCRKNQLLGLTHVYLSPILTARAGSMHGYDVVDHGRINPELGCEEALSSLAAAGQLGDEPQSGVSDQNALERRAVCAFAGYRFVVDGSGFAGGSVVSRSRKCLPVAP